MKSNTRIHQLHEIKIYILIQKMAQKLNKCLLVSVAIFAIGKNASFAQQNKKIGYLNSLGDSIRFSICINAIDTILAGNKINQLAIIYDEKSDYYQINYENIHIVSLTKV